MTGRNAMEEFKGATSVIVTQANQRELDRSITNFEQSVIDFDQSITAIIEDGTINGGVVVLPTDNPQLANEVLLADKVHNDKFQPAAAAMIVLAIN